MNKKCKLFLMASITYKENLSGGSSYIDVMRKFLKSYPYDLNVNDSEILTNDRVFYEESKGLADVSEIFSKNAVDMARNLSMGVVKNFADPYTPIDGLNSCFRIEKCSSSFFYDAHAYFTVIYEVDISYSEGQSENEIIKEIFKERKMYENLGIEEYVLECQKAAIEKIEEIFNSNGLSSFTESIVFEKDNVLPFIMFAEKFDVDKCKFQNEESVQAIKERAGIASSYESAFFHPGWNYTVASGLPYEVFVNLLHMMVRAQSFFFSIGYMKSYYTGELTKTLREKDSIAEFHVETAEDVQLAFYDLLAKFNGYKNKLFPKYQLELTALMKRWHCDSDIENIKSYIDLDLQSKDRIHSTKVEKQNDRQNKALTFIAIIQLISIYGAFYDGSSVFSENRYLFIAGTLTWVFALFVYLAVSRYFKLAFIYGASVVFISYLFRHAILITS